MQAKEACSSNIFFRYTVYLKKGISTATIYPQAWYTKLAVKQHVQIFANIHCGIYNPPKVKSHVLGCLKLYLHECTTCSAELLDRGDGTNHRWGQWLRAL